VIYYEEGRECEREEPAGIKEQMNWMGWEEKKRHRG
jgi:hypothetical protein